MPITSHATTLLTLLVTSGFGRPATPACRWSPAPGSLDTWLVCSSPRVKAPPRMLPQSLLRLQLYGTGLRVLDGNVFSDRQLPHLQYFSVTDGILTSVAAGALCSLTALIELDLSNNALYQVDTSSFECNRMLHRLDLSGNRHLRLLPALVSDSIDSLDAERCSIADVDVEDLRGLSALRILHLSGNPRLDCSAVKNRLAQAYPLLLVTCDGTTSSASPMVSAATNYSTTTPPAVTSMNLPLYVATSAETNKELEINSQNSVSQLHTEDDSIITVTERVSYTTTQVTSWPTKQASVTTEQVPHGFKKVNIEDAIVITHPKEDNEVDSILLATTVVLLSIVLLLSLLIFCLKCQANN